MTKKKIVILTNGSASHLKRVAEKRNVEVLVYSPSDIYLYISKLGNVNDQAYFGNEYTKKPNRLEFTDVSAIIPRISGKGFEYGCAVVRHFERGFGIYTTGTSLGLKIASDKFWCSQAFSEVGIPQPRTIFSNTPQHVDFLIDQVGGLPAVGKFPRGSQGKQVFILESPQAANTALQAFYSSGQSVIIQEFIEAGGKDIRAIVVGDKVVSAMERTGKKDFRANLSQGGSGRNVLNELTEKEKTLCVQAAKACGLEFAGIDFIRNKEGQPLFIEANGNPGEKIIDVTGHDHYEDLLDLIERKIKPGNGAMPTPAVVQPSAAAMAKVDNSGSVMTTTSISGAKANPFAGYDSKTQMILESIQVKMDAGKALNPNEIAIWQVYQNNERRK